MTNNRIKEAEEAAKNRFTYPSHPTTLALIIIDEKRGDYVDGYLAACEKCEGELPRLIDEAIWHFCGEDWSEEAEPGEITKFLEQFKTHNNE